MAISIGSDGKIYAHWVQNGIKHKKGFRVLKDAERYMEIVEEVKNSIKLVEEMEKFNRDFNYDPNIVNLKLDALENEIKVLKERIRVKQAFHRKLDVSTRKLAEQPRNVISRNEFNGAVKDIQNQILNLERFFKEHAILTVQKAIYQSVDEMKRYYHLQKESVKTTDKLFRDLHKDVLEKFSSITTKDKYMDVTDVCKYLGVSRHIVTQMMHTGLPYLRFGTRYRIKENDVKKWVSAQTKVNKFS